jgi:hypothetical protein
MPASKVDAPLVDFPVAIRLASDAGVNDEDLTEFFDLLSQPDSLAQAVANCFVAEDGKQPPWQHWKWQQNNNTIMTINSNKIKFLGDGTTTDRYAKTHWQGVLSGDFDIQIEGDITSLAAPSSSVNYGISLEIGFFENGKQCNMGRSRSSTHNGWHYSGSDTSYTQLNADAFSDVRIRCVRSGSTIKFYYWDDSAGQWEWNGNTAGITMSENYTGLVCVSIWAKQESDKDLETYVDTLQVNSGTVLHHLKRKKVQFTAEDGTPLLAECEMYDPKDEEAVYHVKVPAISATVNTNIYMYFDPDAEDSPMVGEMKPDADEPDLVLTQLWDDDYIGVYHLAIQGSIELAAGYIKQLDSTGKNPMEIEGNALFATWYSTTIDWPNNKMAGRGFRFDGSNDGINLTNTITEFNGDLGTLEVWFNREFADAVSGNQIVAILRVSTDYNISIHYDATSDVWTIKHKANAVTKEIYPAPSKAAQNTNAHMALTWDESGDEMKAFCNGVQEGSTLTGLESWSGTPDMAIGIDTDIVAAPYDGQIYEVRLSKVERTPAWIRASFESGMDNFLDMTEKKITLGGTAAAQSVVSNPSLILGDEGGGLPLIIIIT